MSSVETNITADSRQRRLAVLDPTGRDIDAASAEVEDPLDEARPDAKAWLCVLGAFTFVIPSYGRNMQGFMGSIGTVQSYLRLNQLQDYSSGDVGWISGVYLFLSYFFTLQIGPICDRDGPMAVGAVGVAVTVISFLLMAECSAYWQFMLCIGIFGALGGAIVATIAMAVVAKLFLRRRGLAIGIALTGSSFGSILFPLILRSTLSNLGWQWSMRIMAFTITGIALPGLFCFMPYRDLTAGPSNNTPQRRRDATIDFSAFRSLPFALVATGSFLLEFAIFSIAGLLPTIALKADFAPEDGFILITVLSACSLPGRVVHGIIADKIGPFNAILLTITSALIFMVTLFIPFGSSSKMVLYAFSALWGFCSGSFLSLPPGTMTFFVSFAVLLTIPLGGILLESLGVEPLACLLTAIVFFGGICYFGARGLISGRWLSPLTKV